MKLRKFFGATSRAVLQQVRAELGPDAMIVANRTLPDGIEITAVSPEAMHAMLVDGAAEARVDAAAKAARSAALNPPQPESWSPRRIDPADVTWPPRAETPAAPVAVRPAQSVASKPAPVPALPPTSPAATRAVAAVAPAATARATASAATARAAAPAQSSANAIPVLTDAVIARPTVVAREAIVITTEPASPAAAPATVPTAAVAAPAAAPEAGLYGKLMEEVAALRGMLQGQLAQMAWSETQRRSPLRARLTRDLLASGFSAALAREIAAQLPEDCAAAHLQSWLVGAVARRLHCVDAEHDIVAKGGIYALVGPTGVGKTTTVAKIAARAAMRFGASSLALLTTDSYRVGAHDQLRIYARILGVPVHVVSDREGLNEMLASLSGKHLVLIDTVGMGQRDARVAEQAALLAHPSVRRMLVLNATAQAETLEEVVDVYGGAKGARSGDAIITKLDETARPGQVLDVLIRHELALQFVSNGQRVPEDLHPPSAAYLVHRSLRTATAPASDSPFALQPDELGLVLAGASGVGHA